MIITDTNYPNINQVIMPNVTVDTNVTFIYTVTDSTSITT